MDHDDGDSLWRVKAVLSEMLFGPAVATPGATLSTIATLREALDYLEARYARQVQQDRDRTAARASETQRTTGAGARRGRPPRANANGAAEDPPATGLPLTPPESASSEAVAEP
jgi:hypothetical protein